MAVSQGAAPLGKVNQNFSPSDVLVWLITERIACRLAVHVINITKAVCSTVPATSITLSP